MPTYLWDKKAKKSFLKVSDRHSVPVVESEADSAVDLRDGHESVGPNGDVEETARRGPGRPRRQLDDAEG